MISLNITLLILKMYILKKYLTTSTFATSSWTDLSLILVPLEAKDGGRSLEASSSSEAEASSA